MIDTEASLPINFSLTIVTPSRQTHQTESKRFLPFSSSTLLQLKTGMHCWPDLTVKLTDQFITAANVAPFNTYTVTATRELHSAPIVLSTEHLMLLPACTNHHQYCWSHGHYQYQHCLHGSHTHATIDLALLVLPRPLQLLLGTLSDAISVGWAKCC